MEAKKQSGKNDHVVIVTSEAEGASVKKFRVKRWAVVCAVIFLCIVIGVALGYFINEERIRMNANAKIDAVKKELAAVQAELETERAAKETMKTEYENEIAGLNNKLTILSDTVNQNVVELESLSAQLEKYSKPTLLPLTGAASIEEAEGNEPACIFYAADGALIVATANGVVSELIEEPEQGYKVVIDHGNGYMTVYYNQGEPKVKVGDEIRQGATLFVIEAVNTKLTYRISMDGVYVNPMTIMQISG